MVTQKLAIFASGNGSNAIKIISHFELINEIQVVAVFCNKPNAGVIEKARQLGIPTHVFTKEEFLSGEVLGHLKALGINWIALAGFLWLIPIDMVNAFAGKIFNIHPALLPKYGGKGMYGDHVHRAVLESGDSESGITIHLVDEVYDRGPILFQAKCPVNTNDNVETLAGKIHLLEHENYPVVIETHIRNSNNIL